MLCLAHELAGTDANRAGIEVVAVDVGSPAWRAMYPAAVETFSPFGAVVSKEVRHVAVALRVRGAPVTVPVLSNDGSSIPLAGKPSWLVPLTSGTANVPDYAGSVVLEAMDVELQGGAGVATVREWVRVDQSQDSWSGRAAVRDGLGRLASLPLAAARWLAG